jgi:hypothetical protein
MPLFAPRSSALATGFSTGQWHLGALYSLRRCILSRCHSSATLPKRRMFPPQFLQWMLNECQDALQLSVHRWQQIWSPIHLELSVVVQSKGG